MLRKVNIAWRSHRPLESVRSWVNGSLLDTLHRAGYKLENQTPTASTTGGSPGTEWVLVRSERSLFLLPFSILAFWLATSRYNVLISLSELADGRSELLVAGDVPGRLAKLLKQLASPVAA
jgi:hypothetical protein